MTIREISDIHRKENFIYYRREFTGQVLYGFPDRNHAGKIRISLVDPVDYPVIPVMQGLKEFIRALDEDGKLP